MYPVNWLFGYNGNLPLKDTSPTDRALIQETTVEPYRPTNVFVQFIRHRVVRFSPISPKKSVRLWGYLTVCPPFPNLKEPTDIRWDLWRTLCYWKTHLSRLLNNFYKKKQQGRDSSVGIKTGRRAEQPKYRVSILDWGRIISLLRSVKTGSGDHPASYSMGAGDRLALGKAAGVWSWPLHAEMKLTSAAMPPLPHAPSCTQGQLYLHNQKNMTEAMAAKLTLVLKKICNYRCWISIKFS